MKKRKFKVGDKVVCSENGSGLVTAINTRSATYPVRVEFDNAIDVYTTDGAIEKGGTITLRHAEPEQPQLPDLTKILKVGDKVFDVMRGEVTVSSLNDGSVFPIICSPGYFSYTIDGRSSRTDKLPALYPIDQAPPLPNWPTQPQTFEWEGEVYKAGEWVAVRESIKEIFRVRQFSSIGGDDKFPVTTKCGWRWSELRKLTSFNQPEPTRRKEKEDALIKHFYKEYAIVLGSQEISEIFHLIEKK